ncbi:hypothetical protein J6590_061971 [Homalodisca vitripennis]|nr:hypothetical protein J6590_061971 [Homalodisca vitripennis]
MYVADRFCLLDNHGEYMFDYRAGLQTTDLAQDNQKPKIRGNYKYSTAGQEVEGKADHGNEVRGHYSYTDSKGETQHVEYTAGVNGFVPRIVTKNKLPGE